ncbi:MAG TPA: OmpA family protein [Ferruginibacter sp.]|nr:OmpA family protein [Ferruginibacter sp.]
MAFNLNKNEGANSSSKFDLSKDNPSTIAGAEQGKRRSKAWPFVIAGLLVAGIAAWYFSSSSGPHTENTTATIATADSNVAKTNSSDQTEVTQTTGDTVAIMKPENTNIASTTEKTANIAAQPVNDNNAGQPTTISSTGLNNKTPATFAKGSNAINNLDQSLVKDIITFLQKNSGSVINVHGYASSEGNLAVNQQISQLRADAFKSYLVSKGIAAARINATGKGIGNPIGSNDTEEGRIKNRRVEIVFQ